MYVLRLLIGAALALVVTTILLLMMQSLIKPQEIVNDGKQFRKVADIHMAKTDIDVNVKPNKPEKPKEPEKAPPKTQQSLDNLSSSASSSMQAVSIRPSLQGQLSFANGPHLSASDGEYLPMVKVPPQYPRRALSRNMEGDCLIEFTVSKTGSVKDPRVIECSSALFERTSLEAVLKFKYKPRIENGEPIEVTGVRNLFTYKLSD